MIERYRNFAFGLICLIILVLVLYLMRPFWQAAVWAITLAIIVYPLHCRIAARYGDTIGAIVSTLGAILFVIGPLVLTGLLFYGELRSVASLVVQGDGSNKPMSVPELIAEADRILRPYAQQIGITDLSLKTMADRWAESLQQQTGQFLATGVRVVLNFVFGTILFFFLLRDGRKLQIPALELIPLERDQAQRVLDSVYDMVHATFLGVVLVAILQGSVIGIAYWLLGVPFPFLLTLLSILLAMVPMAGAPVLWVPIAILLASQGQYTKALILVAVGVLIVGQIDTVLKPLIISSRIKLHPAPVFFAFLGGIVTLGPVGVIVGPVVLIVAIGAAQILREMARQAAEAHGDAAGGSAEASADS
ncbi:MAG: AI-2E family transporter [Fimbriimonadales bacterium]|nr:MAG: AI-2E family transporter [Fimbriimonadales bacterium]